MRDVNILLKLIPNIFMKKDNFYEHILRTTFKQQYEEYWIPSIVEPLNEMNPNKDSKAHDHLVNYWGDLKTLLHDLLNLTKSHELLSNDSKEVVLQVYLRI